MEQGKMKDEEANIAAYQRRYNCLLIIFKLFFIFLSLIIVALITYLSRSEFSEQSIHQNPSPQISTTDSKVFKLSLQRAAQQLEDASSFLSNHSQSDAAFDRCRKWLRIGSAQLRETIRPDPFPRTLSEEQRSKMANRVEAAEVYIESCLDDLASMVEPPTAATANEVRERVSAAAEFLRERGNFLRKFHESVWDVILENVIVVCLYGFQILFIFFLFWTIFKSH